MVWSDPGLRSTSQLERKISEKKSSTSRIGHGQQQFGITAVEWPQLCGSTRWMSIREQANEAKTWCSHGQARHLSRWDASFAGPDKSANLKYIDFFLLIPRGDASPWYQAIPWYFPRGLDCSLMETYPKRCCVLVWLKFDSNQFLGTRTRPTPLRPVSRSLVIVSTSSCSGVHYSKNREGLCFVLRRPVRVLLDDSKSVSIRAWWCVAVFMMWKIGFVSFRFVS